MRSGAIRATFKTMISRAFKRPGNRSLPESRVHGNFKVKLKNSLNCKVLKDIDGVNQWPSLLQNLPSKRNSFIYNIDPYGQFGCLIVNFDFSTAF